MESTVQREPYLKIRPQARWSLEELAEFWRFRDLLGTLAGRDVKLRYRQTALGVLWVILQPVLAAGIFSFVFGRVAKLPSGGLPYFLFSYAALLGWNAFQTTITKAGASLVSNTHLISKVYFPRLILPLSTVLSALLDFAIGLVFLVPLCLYYHATPGWSLLLLPLWLTLTVALASGAGFIVSALTVRYRDVQYIVPVLIQFLVYATPVGYAIAAVPAQFKSATMFNPLATMMEGFRASLLGTPLPPLEWVAYAAGCTLLLVMAGIIMFRYMETRFADII